MASSESWAIRRSNLTTEEVISWYVGFPTMFTLEIHHGGRISHPPRKYIAGTVSFVDMVDIDRFSIHELDLMLNEIGYSATEPMYYHFLHPEKTLDDGLEDLGCDQDVVNLSRFVPDHKVIQVYTQHGMKNIKEFFTTPTKTKPKISIQELDDIDPYAIVPIQKNLFFGWEAGSSASVPIESPDHGTTDRESQDNEMDFEADAGRHNEHTVVEDGDSIDLQHGDGDDVIGFESEQVEFDEDGDSIDHNEEHNNMEDDYEVDMNDLQDGDCVANQDQEVVDEVEEVEVLDNEVLVSASESDDNECGLRKHVLHEVRKGKEDSVDFFLGQQFGTKEEAKELVKLFSVQSRRKLKIQKNDATRLRIVCVGDLPDYELDETGVHVQSQDANKGQRDTKKGKQKVGPVNVGGRGKKTNPLENQCPFAMLISKVGDEESWVVRTLINDHKCVKSRKIKACTSEFLSKQMIDQIGDNPRIPTKAVQEQFQRKYEVGVSKMKAYRAKCLAKSMVEGDYRAQYASLWDYGNELKEKNPDTTVRIDVEPNQHPNSPTRQFRRIYVCFGALKRGFKAIGRELLGLDGAFMKGPYPGQMLTAVGIDNNNGIYPLCYAVVEAESLSSWSWFLDCLREDLGLDSTSHFTFISDRQKGLLPAISKIFPNAEQRFCLRHIHENMKLSFRGKLYKDMLWKAATSTTVPEFEKAMEELKGHNKDAYIWLSKIPAVHWSRSHFTGRAVSDVLLNNMCEVYNGKILEGRDKPIISALEYVREYLMRRIVTVLGVQQRQDGLLTPNAAKMLEKIKKDATHYIVQWNGGELYQVSGKPNHHRVVDIENKTCSCRKWELTGMPCCHAVAAIWFRATNGEKVGALESWVNPIHTMSKWKEVYAFKLNPINDKDLWVKTSVPVTLEPPKHHTPVGRPRKARKRSFLEREDISGKTRLSRKSTQGKCTLCGGFGHNRRTCNGQGRSGDGGSAQG